MNSKTPREYLGETLAVELGAGVSTLATVAYADDSQVDRLLLVLPPNPMLGGDSQNNVVQALLAEGAARGALAATFDYRGSREGKVGQVDLMSYWEGLAASRDYGQIVADVAQVVAAVGQAFGSRGCQALAGYSFGCYLALLSAPQLGRPPVAGVSPPIQEYDLRPCLAGLDVHLFAAANDPFCPPELATATFAAHGVTVETMAADDHFFRGVEATLARRVLDVLGFGER